MKQSAISTVSVLSLLLSAATATATDPQLQQLRTLDELAVAFNEDRGSTRLVLLLSPT